MDKNRELGIILSRESINTLFSTFQKDWDKGTDFSFSFGIIGDMKKSVKRKSKKKA